MLTKNDIIGALQKCTAYDSAHTPKPSELVVEAWIEHFEDFPGVTRDDLLQAVKEYHRVPHDVQLQPAHISAIARKYGRERYERSELESAERLKLEAISNAKAQPDELAAIEPSSSARDEVLAMLRQCHPTPAASEISEGMSRPDFQTQLESFAKLVGRPLNEVQTQYVTALAKERRTSAPPTPLACPDCGSLGPCEHDKDNSDPVAVS